MKKLLFIFICSITSLSFSQNILEVGTGIWGTEENEPFAENISINSNGSIIAISSREYSISEFDSNGKVTIFEKNGDIWNQLGSSIIGESIDDLIGNGLKSISLNGEGNRIIIGSYRSTNNRGEAKVYELNNNSWTQLGQSIQGNAEDDELGFSAYISDNGNRIAILVSGENIIRVFDLINQNWVQIGADISNTTALTLSGNGEKIAIVNIGNDNLHDATDAVKILSWNGVNWIQSGQDIDPFENAPDMYDVTSKSLSLNYNGNRFAMGAPESDGYEGKVRIYEIINNQWSQIGSDINGSNQAELGSSISLNNIGDRIVVSSIGEENNNNEVVGGIKIFDYSDNTWNQFGDTKLGQHPWRDFSSSSEISSDGNFIFSSSTDGPNANDVDVGYVKIYHLIPANHFLLSTSVIGEGTASPQNGIYPANSNIVIQATPQSGWLFTGWTGSFTDDYTSSNRVISMTSNITAIANFSDDADEDGLTNIQEDIIGTNPREADSNEDLSNYMSELLTLSEAENALDEAHEDDVVVAVSNNSATVVFALMETTNLILNSWNVNQLITNNISIDDNNVKFLRIF